MTDGRCERTREWIPDATASRLAASEARAVDEHVATCVDCRAELELARLLRAAAPPVPPGLAARVVAAVRADRAPARRPWWGLSAAAVAALALGIGLTTEEPRGADTSPVPGFAYEIEAQDTWLADDGVVAGAPTLDGLSDDALRQLLDELSSGGAA